jgi:nucleoside-diphosphate-sugar epimerase
MNISILGLGWLGFPLALHLKNQGHQVMGSTRSPEKRERFTAEGIRAFELLPPSIPVPELLKSQLLILNIPPFTGQPEWFKTFTIPDDTQIFFISSTSVYGPGSGIVDEISPLSPETTSAKILIEEERWILERGPKACVLRCSGLIGLERHPGNFLAGKKNLKGAQHPVNLIHLDDVIGFISTLIERDVRGEIFNVSSDEHRSKKEFYSEFARKKGLPLPEFDDSDESEGKMVSNEKMKRFYDLKFPRMI